MDHITRIQSKAWRDRSFSHFDMSDLLSCSQKLRSCLLVDTGIDTRVIVSGIAEHYTPEELVGRQVLVLVNLAPRELKGIESKGMILMGTDPTGKLVLLQPAAETACGTTVG